MNSHELEAHLEEEHDVCVTEDMTTDDMRKIHDVLHEQDEDYEGTEDDG